ncbi:RNA-guided pseudouridylation complex pseudouridine synthase subunit Cbf5, partial [Candidatus Micrarchaeota archaeon]
CERNIKVGETVMIMSLKGELVAVATARMNSEQMKEGKKGLAAETKRVIMKQGTYPRAWKRKDPS